MLGKSLCQPSYVFYYFFRLLVKMLLSAVLRSRLEVLVVGATNPYAEGFQDCGGNTKIGWGAENTGETFLKCQVEVEKSVP